MSRVDAQCRVDNLLAHHKFCGTHRDGENALFHRAFHRLAQNEQSMLRSITVAQHLIFNATGLLL